MFGSGTLRGLPRVLLVEDHQDTRQMYAEFLGMEFDVVTAADGEEALDLMRSHLPDVLVTDLSLPGIDGFELIARVRADASFAAIPMICLSGYGGHAHEQRARAAGCDRILQKPCMPDKLAEIVAELVHEAASRKNPT
jgi:CheY-like chemotaxis protein